MTSWLLCPSPIVFKLTSPSVTAVKKKKKLVQLNDTNTVSCHRRVSLLLLRLTSQVMLEVKIFFYSKFPTNFAPNNAAQPLNTPPNFAGCTNTLMR